MDTIELIDKSFFSLLLAIGYMVFKMVEVFGRSKVPHSPQDEWPSPAQPDSNAESQPVGSRPSPAGALREATSLPKPSKASHTTQQPLATKAGMYPGLKKLTSPVEQGSYPGRKQLTAPTDNHSYPYIKKLTAPTEVKSSYTPYSYQTTIHRRLQQLLCRHNTGRQAIILAELLRPIHGNS